MIDPIDNNAYYKSGEISLGTLPELYNEYPWIPFLKKYTGEESLDSKSSPGIILYYDGIRQIQVSIVGEVESHEYYVIYIRPIKKIKRKWFRKIETWENFRSICPQQSKEDGLEALQAFLKKDFQHIEERWG